MINKKLILIISLVAAALIVADYTESYKKGIACLKSNDFRAAVYHFDAALSDCDASDKKVRSRVHLRLGEAYYQLFKAEGETANYFTAVENLEKALLLSDGSSVVAEFLKNIRYENRDLVIPADHITRSLANKKAFGVEPTIDLIINFDLNKATLNDRGIEQAHQLGRALSSPAFDGCRFMIIGHTDKTGTDAINDPLSYNRSETVMKFLISFYSMSSERIIIKGKGSREPRYHGDTKKDCALNRRVEVKVLD